MSYHRGIWDGYVAHKLKCAHCDDVVDSGLMNIFKHQEKCGAITVERKEGFTITVYPWLKFDKIKIQDDNTK